VAPVVGPCRKRHDLTCTFCEAEGAKAVGSSSILEISGTSCCLVGVCPCPLGVCGPVWVVLGFFVGWSVFCLCLRL